MKKSILFLFLLAFTLHVSSNLLIAINFLFNQDYIAQTRCENKAKPMLKCNGKCQLSKELKKEEERKKDKPTIESVFVLSLPEKTIEFSLPQAQFLTTQNHLAFENTQKPETFSESIFHPPNC